MKRFVAGTDRGQSTLFPECPGTGSRHLFGRRPAMDAITEFTHDLLVSLHPRHASNILSGEKTVELRRRFPEQHTRGALALIYSTKPVTGGSALSHPNPIGTLLAVVLRC